MGFDMIASMTNIKSKKQSLSSIYFFNLKSVEFKFGFLYEVLMVICATFCISS